MRENALFESHFDLIPFSIYVVDAATYTMVYSNRAFIERFGRHVGVSCHKVLYERDEPCTNCRMAELLTEEGLPNGNTLVFEHFNEIDDRWYQMQIRAMTWPDGRVVKYSIAVDISDLKDTQNRLAEAHAELALKNRELMRLSTTDMLTGLANRQRLDALLGQALDDRSGPISLMMLDIDHFKRINDRFGHPAGDRTLAALAEALRQATPEGCTLGRWGGEEFLILCRETMLADAYLLAEALRERVLELELPDVGRLSCSFGVVEAAPSETAERLMSRVDQALYAAKELGRNRVEAA
ncbi:diguanylate cyclase [Solidesulfovibrio fructosivorans JJ]]|uniref:diguanylate cyclase n=1 Tax=Solidesulfovibrio fructosivorans JJ] TaxID=596151 RepID=E1JU01_SOLFR|nr:sensor domain-containing diguanylate cyclase [Solidesulfovibrio fructosivorans]EFL52280.1 diguanylate cyclase [Solidesulfovibrio fructosivorans JJ]]